MNKVVRATRKDTVVRGRGGGVADARGGVAVRHHPKVGTACAILGGAVAGVLVRDVIRAREGPCFVSY